MGGRGSPGRRSRLSLHISKGPPASSGTEFQSHNCPEEGKRSQLTPGNRIQRRLAKFWLVGLYVASSAHASKFELLANDLAAFRANRMDALDGFNGAVACGGGQEYVTDREVIKTDFTAQLTSQPTLVRTQGLRLWVPTSILRRLVSEP